MPTWLTGYLTDPTKRTALLRAAIAAVGYATSQGWLPSWFTELVYSVSNNPALAGAVAALLIPAGQKNAT